MARESATSKRMRVHEYMTIQRHEDTKIRRYDMEGAYRYRGKRQCGNGNKRGKHPCEKEEKRNT